MYPEGSNADHGPAWSVGDPAFPYREDLLQFIWEQRLFDARGLATMDGDAVFVDDPGRRHVNSGPDLLGARVRIAGREWAGTVEVHVRSGEWYQHRHDQDPAYNNVILHVVYAHDLDVRTQAGARMPTVELRDRIRTDRLAVFNELMRSRAWVPCEKQLLPEDLETLPVWMERLVVERLERKCGAVGELYDRLGRDPVETFWHSLARGFGFNVNVEPFGMLAAALPWRVLMKYRDDPLRVEALLIGQAGLLRVDMLEDHPRILQMEHGILARLHDLHPIPMAAWRFGRLRPPNFPSVRIAQLARLIAAIDGSFSALLETTDPDSLVNLLRVEAGGYWLTHHRFDQPTAPIPKRLGEGSVIGLIINVVVPYLFAMGRSRGVQAWCDRALGLLEGLPAEQNVIVKRWADRGVQADTAANGQALIELKNLYCTPRRCLSCVIGNRLLKRSMA